MAASRRHRHGVAAGLAGVLVLLAVTLAHGQEANRWGFGTDLGLTAGTVNDTVFTLGFNADYYLDRAFSVGPMVLLSPIGDLTQIAIAGVGRYHIRAGSMRFVPFAGLGLVHADLDRGSGPGRIDRNDTSWYIPLGMSAEYPINPSLAFATTLIAISMTSSWIPRWSGTGRASPCSSGCVLDHDRACLLSWMRDAAPLYTYIVCW